MISLLEIKGFMRSGHISKGRMGMIDQLKKETQDQMKKTEAFPIRTAEQINKRHSWAVKKDPKTGKWAFSEGNAEKIKLGGKTQIILQPTMKDTETVISDKKKKQEVNESVKRIQTLLEFGIHDKKIANMTHHDHANHFIKHNNQSEEMHGLSMAIANYRNEHKRKMSSIEYKEHGSHAQAAKTAAQMHLKQAHTHLMHFIVKAPHEEIMQLKKDLPAVKKYFSKKFIDESEDLDEMSFSKKQLGQYIIRATTDMKRLRDQKNIKKLEKRTIGVNMALKKMGESVELDEISDKVVGSYTQKATSDLSSKMLDLAYAKNKQDKWKFAGQVAKRQVGLFRVGRRLQKEELDEGADDQFKKHPKYADAHCAGFNGWKCPTGKNGYEQQAIDRGYLEGSQKRRKALEKKNESLDESSHYHSVFYKTKGGDDKWRHHFDADDKEDAKSEAESIRDQGDKVKVIRVAKKDADWRKVDPHEFVMKHLKEDLDEGLISNAKYSIRKFLTPNKQKDKIGRLLAMQKQNAQNIPRVNSEEVDEMDPKLNELFGKGKLGSIENYHRSEGSKATKSLTSRSSLRVFRDVFAKATKHSIQADRAKKLMTKEEVELDEGTKFYTSKDDWKNKIRSIHGNRVKFKNKMHPDGGIGNIHAYDQSGKELRHYWDVGSANRGYVKATHTKAEIEAWRNRPKGDPNSDIQQKLAKHEERRKLTKEHGLKKGLDLYQKKYGGDTFNWITKEETELNELKSQTLKSYADKRQRQLPKSITPGSKEHKTWKLIQKARDKAAYKDSHGGYLTPSQAREEVELDEAFKRMLAHGNKGRNFGHQKHTHEVEFTTTNPKWDAPYHGKIKLPAKSDDDASDQIKQSEKVNGDVIIHKVTRLREETELNEWSILRGRLRIGHIHLRNNRFHAKPQGGPVKRFNTYGDAENHVRNYYANNKNQSNQIR